MPRWEPGKSNMPCDMVRRAQASPSNSEREESPQRASELLARKCSATDLCCLDHRASSVSVVLPGNNLTPPKPGGRTPGLAHHSFHTAPRSHSPGPVSPRLEQHYGVWLPQADWGLRGPTPSFSAGYYSLGGLWSCSKFLPWVSHGFRDIV